MNFEWMWKLIFALYKQWKTVQKRSEGTGGNKENNNTGTWQVYFIIMLTRLEYLSVSNSTQSNPIQQSVREASFNWIKNLQKKAKFVCIDLCCLCGLLHRIIKSFKYCSALQPFLSPIRIYWLGSRYTW